MLQRGDDLASLPFSLLNSIDNVRVHEMRNDQSEKIDHNEDEEASDIVAALLLERGQRALPKRPARLSFDAQMSVIS